MHVNQKIEIEIKTNKECVGVKGRGKVWTGDSHAWVGG